MDHEYYYENLLKASQSKFTSSCNVNTNSSSKCCLSKCQCEKDDAGQIILAQVNFTPLVDQPYYMAHIKLRYIDSEGFLDEFTKLYHDIWTRSISYEYRIVRFSQFSKETTSWINQLEKQSAA